MKSKIKENPESQIKQLNWDHILGWVLFIIGVILFMVSGWKNNDIWTFIGSIFFFIACIVFLVPLLKPNKKREERLKK